MGGKNCYDKKINSTARNIQVSIIGNNILCGAIQRTENENPFVECITHSYCCAPCRNRQKFVHLVRPALYELPLFLSKCILYPLHNRMPLPEFRLLLLLPYRHLLLPSAFYSIPSHFVCSSSHDNLGRCWSFVQ